MQSDDRWERPGTLRAIERRMQDHAGVWNIDLLRRRSRLRTGEGGDDNKGQGAVNHGFVALACQSEMGFESPFRFSFLLNMIFSENRYPLFRIML
jgi:hypothetical protein